MRLSGYSAEWSLASVTIVYCYLEVKIFTLIQYKGRKIGSYEYLNLCHCLEGSDFIVISEIVE